MGQKPVFQDSFEVSIWKRLNSDPDSHRRSDHVVNIAENIIKREGSVNSSILTRTIELLYDTQSDGMQMLIDQLVGKSRPNDCMPALTAAIVCTKLERWDKAEELVESVKRAQNIPMVSCVRAKILVQTGEMSKAKKELMPDAAIRHSPCSMRSYNR